MSLRVATPSEERVDARGLLAFLDELETHPGIRPHGLVVLHDGARIAEGWWAPFAPDRVQLLYSLSKSFTSTAVGLARAEGLVDLDATVLSYFPELDADITDPRSRAMRVRDVAAMASGHALDTIDRAAELDPADLVRGFLLLPPDSEPGSRFAYNQPCTYALARIVQRVTGSTLIDYLRPRVFEPLGIGEAVWLQAPPGTDLGFSGLHSTADAVARLGELYRRGGMWGDRRILDEEWVDLATRRHIDTAGAGVPDWERGYGFQFWMSKHGYRGDGAFGQFCVVVPEKRLVVAITSETEFMQEVLDALWEHVIPAIGAGGDADADAELAERLAVLSLPPAAGEAEPPAGEAWDGREFAASGPITAVRVAAGEDGWTLTLVDDGGEVVVPIGGGSWRVREGAVPVAGSGGWTAGALAVEAMFLEAPHTLRVHCTPDGVATARWNTVPLHSTRPSDQHRP